MSKTKKLIILIFFQILSKSKEIIPIINSVSKLISIFPKELKSKFQKKNYQIYLLSHKIYNSEKRKDKIIFYCKDEENIFYIGIEVKISSESFENENSIKSFLFSENLSKILNFFDLKLNDLNFIDSSENYTKDYIEFINQDLNTPGVQNSILNKIKNQKEPEINKNKNFAKQRNIIIESESINSKNSNFQPQSKYLNSNIKMEKSKKIFNRNNKNEDILDALKEIKNISLKNNYENFVNIKPGEKNGDFGFIKGEDLSEEVKGKKGKNKINDYFLSFLH